MYIDGNGELFYQGTLGVKYLLPLLYLNGNIVGVWVFAQWMSYSILACHIEDVLPLIWLHALSGIESYLYLGHAIGKII